MEASARFVYNIIVNHPKVKMAGIRSMMRIKSRDLCRVIEWLKQNNYITEFRNGYTAVSMYTQLSLYDNQ